MNENAGDMPISPEAEPSREEDWEMPFGPAGMVMAHQHGAKEPCMGNHYIEPGSAPNCVAIRCAGAAHVLADVSGWSWDNPGSITVIGWAFTPDCAVYAERAWRIGTLLSMDGEYELTPDIPGDRLLCVTALRVDSARPLSPRLRVVVRSGEPLPGEKCAGKLLV